MGEVPSSASLEMEVHTCTAFRFEQYKRKMLNGNANANEIDTKNGRF
jgi:hypothetical protein